MNRYGPIGRGPEEVAVEHKFKSSLGTAVGCDCACGFMVKNRGRLLRERASVDLLSTPAMWRADIEMSYVAQKKNSEHKSCMSWDLVLSPFECKDNCCIVTIAADFVAAPFVSPDSYCNYYGDKLFWPEQCVYAPVPLATLS